MVGTVLKYEFIRTKWAIALGWGFTLLLALISYGAAHISGVVAGVPIVLGIIAVAALPFAVQLYLGIHLYRSTFGRRGYFELTVPVKNSTLIATKFLWASLVSLISLVVSAVALWLVGKADAVLGGSALEIATRAVSDALSDRPDWGVIALVVGLLTYLSMLAQIYFAVVIGSEAWINKSGGFGPVIVYIIVYVAMQLIGLVLLLIPPTYDFIGRTWYWTPPLFTDTSADDAASLPVLLILGSILLSAVMLWQALVSVQRRLELR
ncbi:hypothetical protein [uncultured Tessaracoccus sp.]|uniref:hypothetical protein n=1 Tax=uncultured Tessaracoccus sp. TaxID=905023 RepID=UPI002627C66D|nr:hypothetical protein [uncultured Tessaracoccus sp.]